MDRQHFDAESLALADLLQSWDFLGVYEDGNWPGDDEEYDDLIDPMRRWLESGATPAELSSNLADFLYEDYGIERLPPLSEIEFTTRVYEWWHSTERP